MRVAFLINNHALNQSSGSSTTTSDESPGFHKVLGDASDSAERLGTSGQSPLRPRDSSLPVSKHTDANRQSGKAGSQADTDAKTHKKHDISSELSTNGLTDSSFTQAKVSFPVLSLQMQETAVSRVEGGTAPITSSNGSSSPDSLAVDNASDAGDMATPASTNPSLLTGMAPNVFASSSPAADKSVEPVPEESKASEVRNPVSGDAENATVDGSATGPSVPNVGPQSTATKIMGATPVITSSPAPEIGGVKSGAGSVQHGHTAKASSTAGNGGKHPSTGIGASTNDGTGNATSALTTLSDNPGDSQTNSQRDQAGNAASSQQQSSPAAQSPSGAIVSLANLTALPDANHAVAASQSSVSGPVNMPEAANLPDLSSAQLIHSVRHAEMRLGLRSDEFGSMSISTTIGRQALSAEISTEHLELGRALAVHVPAMEQKLSTAYGLPARVEVNNGASSSSGSSDQQSQSGRQQTSGSPAMQLFPGGATPVVSMIASQAEPIAGSSRLDIRV